MPNEDNPHCRTLAEIPAQSTKLPNGGQFKPCPPLHDHPDKANNRPMPAKAISDVGFPTTTEIAPPYGRGNIVSCRPNRRCSRKIGTTAAEITAAASTPPAGSPIRSALTPHRVGPNVPPA